MRRWQDDKKEKPRIEIIPMIDVMMFLLVFFVLLSLNVIPAAGMKANLPTSSNPEKISDKVVLTVRFLQDGSYQFDNKSLNETELVQILKTKVNDSQPIAVMLVGDADVSLQQLVNAMDVVKLSGIKSVSVAAKTK
ncbi:MAG: biopolymer transporter ExbD [Thiotrichales bacterium]|jgi:biopolymer transport protein ExbD|nr:biopolymer transporter ExbD [Thiotrichales bacterium]